MMFKSTTYHISKIGWFDALLIVELKAIWNFIKILLSWVILNHKAWSKKIIKFGQEIAP